MGGLALHWSDGRCSPARLDSAADRQPASCQPQVSPRPAPPVLTRHPIASPSPPLVRHTKQVRTYGRPAPSALPPRQAPPSRAQQMLQATAGRAQSALQQGIPVRRPSLQPRPSHVEQPQHYVMAVPTVDQTAGQTRMVAVPVSGAPHQYRLVTQPAASPRLAHTQYSVVAQAQPPRPAPAPADGPLLLVDAAAGSAPLVAPQRQEGIYMVTSAAAARQQVEITGQR